MFIDASYEGDVLAAVANNNGGATYTYGRESSATYSEDHAGVRLSGTNTISGATLPLYPFINNPAPNASAGDADKAVQGYNYRPCIQTIANGGIAFPQPAGYSASLFQLVGQVATANNYTSFTNILGLGAIEGNKYCLNDGTSWGTMTNQNVGYPDGTPTQRAAIIAAHKAWYQGILYYMAHDPGVPAGLNTDAALYGLPPDEFPDNGNWPYQMYVREARRMVGSYVMTQTDIINGTTQTHSVGWCNYALDTHACGAYATGATTWVSDGLYFDTSQYAKAEMPMECLIPQAGQCPNLIVPVCLSASHVAWGPIRMEATLANMGEAAGLMAYRVAKGLDPDVQHITYSSLQTLMTAILTNTNR